MVLVARHGDATNLLLDVLSVGLFYVLVFRNLSRDLALARTILIVLTAVLSIYWLSNITQGYWLFAAIESINLLLALWMIYEVTAMVGARKL